MAGQPGRQQVGSPAHYRPTLVRNVTTGDLPTYVRLQETG
jgi:hypothetical protein